MEFVVQGSKRNKKFVEAILPSLITQLNLTNSRKTLIVDISNTGSSALGYTTPLDGIDAYAVVITPQRKLKEIGLTLAHEMVHVRQMAKGILKSTSRGTYLWAGKKYSKKTPYLELPWEVDAFQRTEILFRKAIEE